MLIVELRIGSVQRSHRHVSSRTFSLLRFATLSSRWSVARSVDSVTGLEDAVLYIVVIEGGRAELLEASTVPKCKQHG